MVHRRRFLERAKKSTLDDAFIALLPPEKRGQRQEVIIRPRAESMTRRRRSRLRGLRADSGISSLSTM